MIIIIVSPNPLNGKGKELKLLELSEIRTLPNFNPSGMQSLPYFMF